MAAHVRSRIIFQEKHCPVISLFIKIWSKNPIDLKACPTWKREDLCGEPNSLWEGYQEDGVRLFTMLYGGRMRDTMNIEMRFTLDIRNNIFLWDRQLKRLHIEIMQSPFWEVFKTWQDKALSNPFWSQLTPRETGSWIRDLPRSLLKWLTLWS